MKQRLMALTIDFKQAFNTVALITAYCSIRQNSNAVTLSYVTMYLNMIQSIESKKFMHRLHFSILGQNIYQIENLFKELNSNADWYCPWAENVSSSIEEDIEVLKNGPWNEAEWTPEVVEYAIDETASFNENNLVTVVSIEEKIDRLNHVREVMKAEVEQISMEKRAARTKAIVAEADRIIDKYKKD